MIGLGVLAGAFVIGLPVAVIYLLVGQSALRTQIAALERKLYQLTADTKQASQSQVAVSELTVKNGKPPKAAAKVKTSATASAATVMASRQAEAKAAVAGNPKEPVTPSVPNLFDRLFAWLSENWFYAVSAVSLALAGLFLVQYGMENGMLPPAARVASALAFGLGLIGVGEYIRRRFGEAEDSATAYLPSVFAGAGLVSLFGAVLSAQMLYGLIGGTTGMIGMIVVAGIAMVLGWFYGPLLAAIGVIGAFCAPMVLGGSDSDPTPLFAYFAVVAFVGLGVDTMRRWAWISGLTLVLAYVMGTMLFGGDRALTGAYQVYLISLVVMAVLIPARAIMPDHAGSMLSEWAIRLNGATRPIFPVLLAWAAMAASCILLVLTSGTGDAEFWLVLIALAGLSAAVIVWSLRATALQDLALIPLGSLVAAIGLQSGWSGARFVIDGAGETSIDVTFPLSATIIVAIVMALSALAAWRSLSKGGAPVIWALVAAMFVPLVAMVLEMGWVPANILGVYPWALHAAVMAAFMVFWAERFARADGPDDRLRMSFFVLSALASISFALVMILSSAALTVALAVIVVAAAALDRRFDLYPMTIFIAAGVVTLGYRLVADPGLGWATGSASIFELVLAYGGVLAAMIAGLWLLRGKVRQAATVMMDSAAWSVGGIFVSLILFRIIDASVGGKGHDSHWSMGIYAAIWFTLALAQVQRMEINSQSWMREVRKVLGAIFAVVGLSTLAAALTMYSPLFMDQPMKVAGPPLFNTLAVAYLLPALVLTAGWLRIKLMPTEVRIAM